MSSRHVTRLLSIDRESEGSSLCCRALRERDAKLSSLKRNTQADKTRSAQMLDEARRREGDLGRDASKAQVSGVQQRHSLQVWYKRGLPLGLQLDRCLQTSQPLPGLGTARAQKPGTHLRMRLADNGAVA